MIKRIMDSAKARIRDYQSKHYERTHYGKALQKLKNSHKGERCFVIGNGPSLSAKDLQRLHEEGIETFATNRIFKIFDQTEWRPTYYVSEDINVLRGVQEEVAAMKVRKKFIPINLKWYEGVNVSDAIFFWMDYNSKSPETFDLSMNIPHGIRCRSTVTTTCIQLAYYMGFSKIYLLGVDHSFSKMIDKNGNVLVDNSIQSHFSKDYDSDIKDLGFSVDIATEAYMDIERLSRKQNDFRVYNATRGGKLEVFERVNFDIIIQK